MFLRFGQKPLQRIVEARRAARQVRGAGTAPAEMAEAF
jgi:hypothetical protein